MLRFLRVRQLAVIDAVDVELDPGLNVLTGETGAGKSVLVEAVSLLLGGRASGDLVRTGADLATVEAIFEGGGVERLVRREITAQGRSRAFVDGELTTAGALRDLAAGLIELHGQHEHQTLLDPATHLAIVDAFGSLDALLASTARAYDTLHAADAELASFRKAVAERGARQELAAFQLAELDRANLKPDEDLELAAARQILAGAERVERLCAESYAALYERDDAVLAALGGVWRRVSELATIDPRFQPHLDARDGVKSQLEDLALLLRRCAEGIEASPARLQQVEERLALLERLKRKYGPALRDAIERRDRLRSELADLAAGDERIAELERARQCARDEFVSVARRLSTERRQAGDAFARSMERTLGDLAMERSRFEVRFTDLEERAWTGRGLDQAEFLLSPNPGEELRPLARIVSGGELSRIMLAIKTLVAATRHGFSEGAARPPSAAAPGLIFDEVDAGIGGRVADVVGRKLRALGSTFQVVCITHLPQIAAYADTHIRIEKRVEAGRTWTRVVRLTPDARVEEISRMLSGASVTDGIRASAREMLEERRSLVGPVPDAGSRGAARAKGESERAKADAGIRPESSGRTPKTR
jgi:DNA repair protein RecN (Recombination protein N)